MSAGNSLLVEIIQVSLAEVLGTSILLYLGCIGAPQGYAAVSFGAAIVAAVQAVGHISGAHINPAVTLAAAIMDQIDWGFVPVYVISQFLGAILGYGVLYICIVNSSGKHLENVCVTTVSSDLHWSQGFVLEMVMTMVLIWMICPFWDDRNVPGNGAVASVILGLGTCGMFHGLGFYTGGSLNTARSFAPSLLNWNWKHHWIVGHISGAHLNPAVTLGAAIMDQIHFTFIPVYVFSQFIGAFAGYGLFLAHSGYIAPGIGRNYTLGEGGPGAGAGPGAEPPPGAPGGGDVTGVTGVTSGSIITTPSDGDNVTGPGAFSLCATYPTGGDASALFCEMAMAAILVFLYCTYWDDYNSNNSHVAITMGLVYGGITLAIYEKTRASLNTARTLAPALFHMDFGYNHWIYWLGPNLGGMIASFVYKFFFLRRPWQYY